MQSLRREFKAWLLDPAHFGELDRGTVLIPEKFLATGAIAPTPVGFAPSNLQPAFGLVQGDDAARRSRIQRKRRRRGPEEGGGARRRAAKHPLGRGLRAPAQRHDLRGLPSNPRHRRLSFPRRRLDGGQARQFNRGAGLAAFLRRPDPPPRYSRPRCATANARTTRAAFPAGRNCAAAPNSPAPNMKTAGARIAMSSTPTPPTTTAVSGRGPAPRGLRARPSGEASRMGMCFVESR